jgi:nucleolar complex protein 2
MIDQYIRIKSKDRWLTDQTNQILLVNLNQVSYQTINVKIQQTGYEPYCTHQPICTYIGKRNNLKTMKSQTKRTRKFQAKGGVKSRLEKGTITKKGKLKKRGGSKDPATESKPRPKNEQTGQKQVDRSDDFLGEKNLGDLDIDSFFAKFSEEIDDGDDAVPVDSGGEDDSDDDEDDASSEENQQDSESIDDDSSDIVETRDRKLNEDEAKKSIVSSKRKKGDTGVDDSSDSEDDEEDVAVAEQRMKNELMKLKENDPEFHQYLAQNEKSLLEFNEDDDDEVNSDKNDDDDDAEMTAPPESSKSGGIVLTLDALSSLEQGAFKSYGIKSLKKLVAAYRAACHLADSVGKGSSTAGPGESGATYIIDSSEVFDRVILLCLTRFQEAFSHHLLEPQSGHSTGGEESNGPDNEKAVSPKLLEKSPRWSDMKPILMSFFRSSLHILEEAKEPELISFILKGLSRYLRFLTPFPRVAEAMLKVLTRLWSAPLDTSENYQVVRLNAFLRIRQLALTQPFPFIEEVLKKTYLAYAKRGKLGSGASMHNILPTLTFMGNCLVELYSLDYHSSYQHAFVYIRQLALHLRTAMTKKTKDAFQAVYCWQYIICLKLWVAVLSSACSADDGALLKSLIYPLTEVILGAVRLVPSPTRHLPLRFHCVQFLQQLAAATETFIPTTSLLLDILDWREWNLKPKKSRHGGNVAQHMDMALQIRLPKEDTLRTHEQLEAGMSEFFVLLQREIELYRYSAGFPEFSVRIVTQLRSFAKDTRNPRWRTYARGCIDTCDRYSSFAVQARAKLAESPKDVRTLECIRPPSQPSMGTRHQEAVAKAQKALEASRLLQASASKRKTTKKESDSDDNDASEDEAEAGRSSGKKQRKEETRTPNDKNSSTRSDLLHEADDVHDGIDWSDDE